MNRFIPQNDEERQAILSLYIIALIKEVIEVANEFDDWILVGSMTMRRRGVWEYAFEEPANMTMYSPSTGLRRLLTHTEVETILKEIEDEQAKRG